MVDQPIWIQETLTFTALGSAAVAGLGVLIQGLNARSQIRATVVSANRQKWLDNLREEVSTCMSCVWAIGSYTAAVSLRKRPSKRDEEKRFEWEDMARASLYKTRLLLDESDADEASLFAHLKAVVDRKILTQGDDSKIAALVQHIVKREMAKMRIGR